ncbi:MAG TPA: YtxH domain-containing protein [Chitinophagaceae bacterium]
MNNSGKILAAVAAGIAAGAVLGILFAPDKGSETRRKISEQGKKMADGIKVKINQGKEKFEDLKERGKEKFDDLKERFEHKKNEKEEFA